MFLAPSPFRADERVCFCEKKREDCVQKQNCEKESFKRTGEGVEEGLF